MRVVLYGRVSTVLHQDVETQMKELRELCKNKNWEIVDEYTDVISGSKEKRVSLDKLMKDGLLGKFDCVCVYSVDRLSRSVKHFVETIKELDEMNIKVFFLSIMNSCICWRIASIETNFYPAYIFTTFFKKRSCQSNSICSEGRVNTR